MKRFIAPLFAVVLFSVRAAHGEGFSIGWQVLDARIGTCRGDAYSITGVIGQPTAGALMTGGGFSVAGGVTSLALALGNHDGPLLRIESRGANLLVAWPSSRSGFQLQQSPSLVSPSWSEVLVAPAVVGSENQVTLPFAAGHRFFRLHKP